jgi:hypothetical protein
LVVILSAAKDLVLWKTRFLGGDYPEPLKVLGMTIAPESLKGEDVKTRNLNPEA